MAQNRNQVNERIRARVVRLIDENGKQLGIKQIKEALEIAKETDLDLVAVSPEADPPVCKLLDYGKFKRVIMKTYGKNNETFAHYFKTKKRNTIE